MPTMVCSLVLPAMAGLAVVVEQLQPLALADRVVAEHRQAVLGHQDAGALIRLGRLAVGPDHRATDRRRECRREQVGPGGAGLCSPAAG